ncbi:hypothetical protein [Nocardioides convexus]|uniref:hypothetical protein n=1 Tax=Nocardioides convexus TaxID=2712224 RepID=UPI003100EBDC
MRTGLEVGDVVLREGRAVSVRTSEGDADADAVVVAVDPRRLPTLAPYVERTMPAIPPVVAHLGLAGDVPPLTHEIVFNAEPTIVVRPGISAPDGGAAWTLHGRGKIAEDMVDALVRHGIDVRDQARHPGGPQPARPRGALARLADGGAVAGPRHGPLPAGSEHPDPQRVRRRRARRTRCGRALRGPVGSAGGGADRPRLSRQTVICSASKISSVALERLSV